MRSELTPTHTRTGKGEEAGTGAGRVDPDKRALAGRGRGAQRWSGRFSLLETVSNEEAQLFQDGVVIMVLISNSIIKKTPETRSPVIWDCGGHRQSLSHGGREISTETTMGPGVQSYKRWSSSSTEEIPIMRHPLHRRSSRAVLE